MLEGARIRLRPVRPGDYPFLYELSLSQEVGFRWIFRGSTPTFEAFAQSLSQNNVLVQFIIERNGPPPAQLGLIMAYRPDFQNGTVYIAMVVEPQPGLLNRGWPIEAAVLFVDYVFMLWNFRKLYMETTDFSLPAFASGLNGILEQEGCLKQHEFYNDHYWDLYVLALYRQRWQVVKDEWRQRLERLADAAVAANGG